MLKILAISTLMLMSFNLESKENIKDKEIKSYIVKGKRYYPIQVVKNFKQIGLASFYGEESGNLTASGERFKPNGITAAHKTLPLNSIVSVKNLENGKTIIVRINDRGPYVKNRIIDLSKGAARILNINGVSRVEINYLRSAI